MDSQVRRYRLSEDVVTLMKRYVLGRSSANSIFVKLPSKLVNMFYIPSFQGSYSDLNDLIV